MIREEYTRVYKSCETIFHVRNQSLAMAFYWLVMFQKPRCNESIYESKIQLHCTCCSWWPPQPSAHGKALRRLWRPCILESFLEVADTNCLLYIFIISLLWNRVFSNGSHIFSKPKLPSSEPFFFCRLLKAWCRQSNWSRYLAQLYSTESFGFDIFCWWWGLFCI